MNLDELRAVQVDERGTDDLQPLPDSFYRDVADYIEELRAERSRAAERAENPFDSEEVRRLSDEIETAEEVVEAIYERRVGKVVKRASLAAAGMSTDDGGMTDEEAELFSDLVDMIEANRRDVLSVFDGDAGGEPDTDTPADDRDADATPAPEGDRADAGVEEAGAEADFARGDGSGFGAGDAMGGGPAEPAEPAESSAPGTHSDADGEPPPDDPPPAEDDPTQSPADVASPDDPESGEDDDRVTLRITRDVGEVFGVDERTYELGEEDVVTLPAENAKPLLDRGAAQKLE